MVKIVSATVQAKIRGYNHEILVACVLPPLLCHICASRQTPPQTWPRTKKRGHVVPVKPPNAAPLRHIAQTPHQRRANLPHLSRDSHGGKRKNQVFCCWTRPGICISPGMIQALSGIKGGRFSSRQGKMELRKTLCSTTPPLIHHPFATPSPLLHPRSPTLNLPLARSPSIILVIQQRRPL